MRFKLKKSHRLMKETEDLQEEAPNQASDQGQVIEDLGFSSKLTRNVRLINSDGNFNIIRKGAGLKAWHGYLSMVQTSWINFNLIVLAYYLLSNTVFAILYLFVGMDQLSIEVSTNFFTNFANAFFFSVQTFTTVGYGTISPLGTGANFVAALNALVGLMSFALATGLTFARFSRPSVSILFSKNALIAPYKGGKSFMFRIANLRNTQLMDVEASISLTWITQKNGKPTRSYASLNLERRRLVMFPLNWTIVHPVDEKSPLFHKSLKELTEMDVEFIIVIKGFDDTFSQMVQDFGSYKIQDIVYGAKFVPMYHVNEDGCTVLELDKINTYQKIKF